MSDDQATITLDRSDTAPRLARRFVAEALASWGLADLTDDVVLLVSELVSNVIHHTDQHAVLTLRRMDDHLRCSVVDHGGIAPTRRSPAPNDRTGRGLQLVDTLSATWGSNTTGRRNEVWFDVPIPH